MAAIQRWAAFLLVGLAFVLFAGCSSDDEDEPGPGPNPQAADSLTDQGDIALEGILFDLINDEAVEEPEDIDFSGAYNFYIDALNHQSNHVGANFGAGVLEVMMLSRDPDVQQFFDDISAFADSGHFFEVESGGRLLDGTGGITDPVLSLRNFAVPIGLPLAMARNVTRYTDEDDPQMSDLQAIAVNDVLPRIETALQRLNTVAADPEFTFVVTPLMQGDPEEDPWEVDGTEVRLTLAMLQTAKALLLQLCSYNMDFEAYDGAGMLAALSQNSSFAALNHDGADRMHNARLAWLAAADHLSSAITFLRGETDYQGDDVIRLDPFDNETAELVDSLEYYLPQVRNALNASQVFYFDTDDNDFTPAEAIEFSLYAFYEDPVENWKAMFPPYTVTLDTQAVETDWHNIDQTVSATISFPSANNYYWSHAVQYEYGEEIWNSYSSNIAVPEFDQAVNAMIAQYRDMPYFYVSLSMYGWFDAGTQNVARDLWGGYEEPGRMRFVPVITWDANTYAEWILPDATFGGFLPGMTDGRFKELVGMTVDDWTKSSVWYLW